jgi:type 2 lantibiotic biosynthesis protein LanM
MLPDVDLAATPAPSGAAWPDPDWWRPAVASGEPAGPGRPAWVDVTERAVAAAVPPADIPMDSWPAAFAVPFRSFTELTRDNVAAGIRQRVPGGQAEPEPVANALTAGLGRSMARLAVPTLMRKLELARAGQDLAGADGRERLAGFIRQQSAPAALAALFREYPVLARLIGTASQFAAEAGLELMTRFAADRPAIVAELLGGEDPGPAVAVNPGLGDPHRRGRSVAAVRFADGRTVIYKPRDLASHRLLGEVAGWLNRRIPDCGLCLPRVLTRPGYGWLEFIDHRPLPSLEAAGTFYRRTGVLLAALYVLRATDVHCENLIARGDQPVLIDAETLFHPALPTLGALTSDPAAQALAASVQSVALLPYLDVNGHGVVDRSGLGGDAGQMAAELVLDWDPPATDQARLVWREAAFAGAANRPRAGGQPIEPADYESAVLDGFRLGYCAIADDRDAFMKIVDSAGDLEVRVIIRPSGEYARLLAGSTQPDLLRDARDRDQALDPLRGITADQPLWRELAEHELADLRAGDIPLLISRPATRDVWTSAGQRRPGLLDRTGRSRTLDIIAGMGEVDRRDQEWVISASLATRRPARGHLSSQPMPGPLTAIAAEPVRMLAAVCGLADQIVARGMTDQDGENRSRANWIGLQLVDDIRWMVLPMGASLTDGYLGVGLFLAQLAALTGLTRYAEVARRAVLPVAPLLDALTGNPDLLAAIGCGFTGLGGISYGLARMSVLLDDDELRDWTDRAVRVTAEAADLTCPPWWMTGLSGCLAAMSAVRAELGSAAAEDLANACAGQLTALVESSGGGCVADDEPVRGGFAAGPAGVGWALTRFAGDAVGSRGFRAGQRALRRAGEPPVLAGGALADGAGLGWCSGVAGLLIARSGLDDVDRTELRAAGQALTSRPILHDLSLCHGELGITDALALLDSAAGRPRMSAGFRRQAGRILDAVGRRTRCCGTPGAVETPGLLSGLAGIGYGLLRLGFPDRVPSVLLQEPAFCSDRH